MGRNSFDCPWIISLSLCMCTQTSTVDCTAHSAIFDPVSGTIRPLFIQTDTWCSSGQFDADGTLVQTGGDNDGLSKVQASSLSGISLFIQLACIGENDLGSRRHDQHMLLCLIDDVFGACRLELSVRAQQMAIATG